MDYYNQIKRTLVGNEAYQRIKDYSKNRHLLRTYYEVGKLLVKAQGGEKRAKYGNQLIREYSQRLTRELGKGYTVTSLKYMRQFYLITQKGPTVSDQLTWSHYRELIWLENTAPINYYIWLCQQRNLSVRQLRDCIKHKEYERLSKQTKKKFAQQQKLLEKELSGKQSPSKVLPEKSIAEQESTNATDDIDKVVNTIRGVDTNSSLLSVAEYIKDPILIRSKDKLDDAFSEQILQQLIMEDLSHFLKELGAGFCFIDNEYRIKVGKEYNYIDLLLFNILHNCYVIIELKITALKAEHVGQVQKYMKIVDASLTAPTQQPAVGIVITRKNDRFIKGYCSDERIFGVEWRMIE